MFGRFFVLIPNFLWCVSVYSCVCWTNWWHDTLIKCYWHFSDTIKGKIQIFHSKTLRPRCCCSALSSFSFLHSFIALVVAFHFGRKNELHTWKHISFMKMSFDKHKNDLSWLTHKCDHFVGMPKQRTKILFNFYPASTLAQTILLALSSNRLLTYICITY